MRAVETTPATSLNAGEELSLSPTHAVGDHLASLQGRWKMEDRRAHSRINQPPSFRAVTSKLGGMIGLCDLQRALLDRDSVSTDSVGNFCFTEVRDLWE